MSFLQQAKKEVSNKPLKMLIYGPPKIGKSTFAAEIPNHIFLNLEDGLDFVPNAMKTDRLTNLADVYKFIMELMNEEHNYSTLIIDTIDWLEELIAKDICQKASVKTIEEISFGKGYPLLVGVWKEIVEALEDLRLRKGMNIVMLSHADVKKITPPYGDSYEYYAPKLYGKKEKQETSLAKITEYVDLIGFASTEIFKKSVGDGFSKKEQAISSQRYLFLSSDNPGFLGGTRIKGLPDKIKLDWNAFAEALSNTNK